MDLSMMETGSQTKLTAMASQYMQMGMCMKVSGKMIRPMGRDLTSMQTEPLMQAIGRMTSSMAKGQRLGQMVPNMMDLTMKGRNMEKEL